MSDRAPVRVAHLGLGAFHRAHQAWYTQRANENKAETGDGPWGIESFTGRRPDLARALTAQNDVYSLVVRGVDGDTVERISSIVRATDGADAERWREVLADPRVGVLTLTITEAGYLRGPDGELDWTDEALSRDLASLADDDGTAMVTAVARIVDGLRARRRAGGEPLAVVSCDNLPSNGDVTREVVLAVASRIDSDLADWIATKVSFVSSMVDRITPSTTPDDVETVRRLTGIQDAVPVVTEPFTEWVLCGEFPAGRPAWEAGGARFVERLEPFEQRKLWLLNAAHSLLAYTGLARGWETIDEAIADPWCREGVERLWTEARAVLDLPADEVDDLLEALRRRFANDRIRHRLVQIAADGSQKLGPRVVEVQRRRLAIGIPIGEAGALTIAAWIVHLRDHPEQTADPGAQALAASMPALSAAAQVQAALGLVAPDLVSALAGPVDRQLTQLDQD
ncbi:MAG: mannitol dehydrogenase family protein [Pseudolysinimonas sp.]